MDVAVEHAAGRVREDALGAAVGDFFEVAGDAGEGAACARGAGEGVDAPGELRPDFGAGGLDVGAAVGGVVELVGPDGVGEGGGVALGLVVVVLGVLEGDCGG